MLGSSQLSDAPPIAKLSIEDEELFDLPTSDLDFDELGGSPAPVEDKNGFMFMHTLPKFTLKEYTTRELHSMIHGSEILIDVDYQREVVWTEPRQISLIGSVLYNYYIPPIVLSHSIDETGEEVYTCVDGKQRVTSIVKFFDGQIPCTSADRKKFWYTRPQSTSTSRPVLADTTKEYFANKKIRCAIYTGLTKSEERAVFERVQLGMPLTTAERLQAYDSPWANFARELLNKYVTTRSDDGIANEIQWDTKRARDFQGVLHVLYCCDLHPAEEVPTATTVDKWIQRVDKPTESFKRKMHSAFTDYLAIASNNKYSQGFTKITKKVSPVEFVYIGVLLYCMGSASLDVKANAISNLRKAIRDKHTDVRTNTKVGKDMWHIINMIKVNPSNSSLRLSVPPPTAAVKRGTKRKAAVVDDDEDYRPPAPILSLSSSTTSTRAKKATKS